MNTTIQSAEPSAGERKRPWAALGVLGVAVLAVVAAMVHVQTRPVEPHLVVLPDAGATIPETAAPASPSDTVKIGKSVAPR